MCKSTLLQPLVLKCSALPSHFAQRFGWATTVSLILQESLLFLPPRSIRRAIPPPNFMRVIMVDRGSAIIWSYQRLVRSTKSNISRRRT